MDELGAALTSTDAPMCPCSEPFRLLQENMTDVFGEDDGQVGQDGEDNEDVLVWEIVYTCFVLLFMLVALLSDRVGADAVMLAAVSAFMAAQIITVNEGIAGFANEGLLTVLILFVVAEGISKTGALDWYMGKLLGQPSNAASAQLRLMLPITVVSAFLNNTPVVAVMIPIVQRWAKNIRISAQQLLIPLSFASILGGTCTLIGTSTNLVVVGLLEDRYPNDPNVSIGLFSLGLYGLPIAIAGMAYILVASPFLLPGGVRGDSGASSPMDNQGLLLGARLAPWSPAAGRSVKRSGLRDTGGIYLVSVQRAATGNIHRAVGQEFVLNVGDILYFTGLVEGFGEFCEEHGMEVLTSELQQSSITPEMAVIDDRKTSTEQTTFRTDDKFEEVTDDDDEDIAIRSDELQVTVHADDRRLPIVTEGECLDDNIPYEVGVTRESLVRADEGERMRSINRMADLIRGTARDEPTTGEDKNAFRNQTVQESSAPKIVVTSDHDNFVIIGVDAPDRPGLLLDVSKGLLRLKLSQRHTEASVVGRRSISIWRCELIDSEIPDLEEIWSVLSALLENDSGTQAMKKRGLRVIRATVTKNSSLIGQLATSIDFRERYRAAIVAIQKGGRNASLSTVVFGHGDVLVLQVSEDSPLLRPPPANFYKKKNGDGKNGHGDPNSSSSSSLQKKSGSVASFVGLLRKRSSPNLEMTAALSSNADTNAGASRSGSSAPDVVQSEDVEAGGSPPPVQGDDDRANDSGGEDFGIGISNEGSDSDSMAGRGAADMLSLEVTSRAPTVGNVVDDEIAWADLQVHFVDEDGQGQDRDGGNSREFLTAMQVAPHSNLAKRTIAEIGLDKLPGVFLVSVDRPLERGDASARIVSVMSGGLDASSLAGSEVGSLRTTEPTFTTISPDTPLQVGDVLWFAGSASSVGDLRKVPGLRSYENDEVEKINENVHDRRLVEAVVARRGPLVGKTVKEVRFRTRFGAAVISVHRDGKRVHDHPGKIKLQAGDVLLLEAGPTFIRRSVDNDRSFALLAEVEDSAPPRLSLLIPALVITAAMLAVFTAGVTELLICGLVASILMVMLGILSEQEARDAVNWSVYITIASAFGIGTAMVNSGVAGGVASFLVDVGGAIGIGDAGLLGAVYLATFLISNVVTNNAAAALLFPIAMDAAEQTGIDRVIMSYCLMLGASASFMSPFGYTTNLLIYGPGGYKYADFLRIGTPMQVILWILSIIFLIMDPAQFWVGWLGTAVILALVVVVRVLDLSPSRLLSKSNPESNTSSSSSDDNNR